MQDLDDLYREVILDHFRNPHGKAALQHADVDVDGFNPLCGDELKLQLQLSEGRIEAIHVEPRGCSISVASASMLAQQLPGLSLQEAVALKDAFKAMMRGEAWPESIDAGDLEALAGVQNFPVRIKCALLAWMALEQALGQFDPALAEGVERDADIEVRPAN